MTTPKSPGQIMEELNEMLNPKARIVHDPNGGSISAIHWDKPSPTSESVQTWLRSSMASLLCYMAGRMSEKMVDPEDGELGDINDTVDDCRTLLIEEARKITNETEKEPCRHPQGFTNVNPFAALPPELRCQICWELKITNNE